MFSKQARVNRLVTGALTVVMAAGLVAAPTASAKTRKVKMTLKAPINAATGTIKGSAKGSPFGKCKLTGKLVLPSGLLTLKCKGGKVKLTSTSTSGASNSVKANWRITGGSGKFKGISGKGTDTGTISSSTFKYVGSVNY